MKLRTLVAAGWLAAVPAQALAAQTFNTIQTGLDGGADLTVSGGIMDFAEGFPLGLELQAGFAIVEPGDPLRTRRVFINQNTNGTPEEFGSSWNFGLDFIFPLKAKGTKGLFVFAGPRLALFNAHFNFVGGNEIFDVSSAPWGLGTGLKGFFPITKKVDFVASLGLAYYFPAVITGHDTTYNPDNANVNPHEGFRYQDAVAAVRVPQFRPTVMIGLAF